MNDLQADVARWNLTGRMVRKRMYGAPTERERERWRALRLLNLGWLAAQVATARERDAPTIGIWLEEFRQKGPAGLVFEQRGGPRPRLNEEQRAARKAAVQAPPAAARVALANGNGRHPQAATRREFVLCRFGMHSHRSSGVTCLHRFGFVLKRPKKRLLKADDTRRAAFVQQYAGLQREARAQQSKMFFVDEAHLYAAVDLHATWVLEGEPAEVDSTSPRWGEKASYSSAVCLETGEVAAMRLESKSTAETSVAFLPHLCATYQMPLIIMCHTGPAHGGDALRAYLNSPGLPVQVVRLPASSPDFNADEAPWHGIREEVTANTCFGTKAKVRDTVNAFFQGVAHRADEVICRCRTALQACADALTPSPATCHVDPIAA